MPFADVIGQEALKQQFIQNIKSGKVPHAQLLLGKLGHGGLALALAYAQMLQCENPSETDSCGTCSSCNKAQKLIHPDIHFSYPFPATTGHDEKIKRSTDLMAAWRKMVLENPYFTLQDWMDQFNAENKQPHIPVEECHDIIKRLSLKSFESHYKIMIIWLPEFLGNAGNTLLKILEEPPSDTIFILIAEQAEAILHTILSRMQIIRIQRIATEALAQALTKQHQLPAEEATFIASMAQGDYIEALKIISQEINDSLLMLHEWARFWTVPALTTQSDQTTALIAWIEKFSKIGRENQKYIIQTTLCLLEKIFHYHLTGHINSHHDAEKKFIEQYASKIKISHIEALYNWLNNCHYFLERNANPKILMMATTLKLNWLLAGIPVEDELALLYYKQ